MKTIEEMKDTIAALKVEVYELRTALSTVMSSINSRQEQQPVPMNRTADSNSNNQQWTEVVMWGRRRPNRAQQKAGGDDRGVIVREPN